VGISTNKSVFQSYLGHTAEVNEQYYTFDVSTLQEKAEIVSNIGKRAIGSVLVSRLF
jgi:hypothetical protein